MERNLFIEKLFARAKEAGFDACEVYFSASSEFETDVLKGEILKYSVADGIGLGFRGLIGGKMGYASTQILDEDAIDLLVEGAKTNAALIENDDRQFIHEGGDHYAQVETYNPAIDTITAAQKIEMARELERKTMAADSRVAQVDGCTVFSEESEIAIVNTLGLNVSARSNVIGGYVGAIARDGEKVNSGFEQFCVADPAEIDLAKVAETAANNAVSGLSPVQAPTASTRVVFSPDAAIDLLKTFAGVFSADAAQKGLSLLKGREGEVIAAECVTLADNPLLAGSYTSSPFDGEGVATYEKNVIEGGKLTTLLHNLKTAHKQGVASTGNAVRSYASTVSVAPSNFYFRPSEQSQDALLAQCGDGLLITELQGMHSGANAISGDFSLSAKGFAIHGGKRGEAVAQITVAGNFFQLLKDIEAVGSDLRFSFPGRSCFGSPSLLVAALSVAGK